MRLTIKNTDKNNIENFPFELVERKGVGLAKQPDTICDAIAETASRYYSLYFYEKYGRVANHWFDKVMLIGLLPVVVVVVVVVVAKQLQLQLQLQLQGSKYRI